MDVTMMEQVNSTNQALQKRICRCLVDQHFHVFRDLVVEVKTESVTLTGTVNSFYEKQVAIRACQPFTALRTLVDQVSVENPQPRGGTLNQDDVGAHPVWDAN